MAKGRGASRSARDVNGSVSWRASERCDRFSGERQEARPRLPPFGFEGLWQIRDQDLRGLPNVSTVATPRRESM